MLHIDSDSIRLALSLFMAFMPAPAFLLIISIPFLPTTDLSSVVTRGLRYSFSLRRSIRALKERYGYGLDQLGSLHFREIM